MWKLRHGPHEKDDLGVPKLAEHGHLLFKFVQHLALDSYNKFCHQLSIQIDLQIKIRKEKKHEHL
jgi:hypothetical protein